MIVGYKEEEIERILVKQAPTVTPQGLTKGKCCNKLREYM